MRLHKNAPKRANTATRDTVSVRMNGMIEAMESSRALIPLLIFFFIALLFMVRLVYLQVIVAPVYSAQAQEARTVGFDIEPRRGTIYDRSGRVLAVSVDATTIYANPSEVEDKNATAEALASVLGGEKSTYQDALNGPSTTFAFIQRKADVDVADKVKNLRLNGIYFISDTKREYPNGQTGGQIIGVCQVAQDASSGREYYQGISGLEAYYDNVLSGTPGRYEAERARNGMPIPGGVHQEVSAVDGQDIVVSLDLDLQEALETRLAKGAQDLHGTGGNSVVMDGGTGEIYAAASLPFFNPSDRSSVNPDATKLKCITDTLEPGSVFKTVSALSILEVGSMTPDSTQFCPASISADGYTISDAHERRDNTFTLRKIIDQSSNVGISLSTENNKANGLSGFQNLYNNILKYNLHSKTGVDYPGEGVSGSDACGYLASFNTWSTISAYNMSFGQGLSVTPLQLARFYGALVNDGVECTPHFLVSKPQSDETPQYATQDVVDNKNAIPQMVDMLKAVVTDGTGKAAAIPGYQVAGKTSTAQIAKDDGSGYKKDVYNIGFAGFLANSSSQLVCFVGVNEVPLDGVATPIFKDIMATAIDRFKILPE